MTKPYTSADFDNDWAKERQFIEMGVERMLKPAPHRHQSPRDNTKEDFLAEIVAENVKATQPGRG